MDNPTNKTTRWLIVAIIVLLITSLTQTVLLLRPTSHDPDKRISETKESMNPQQNMLKVKTPLAKTIAQHPGASSYPPAPTNPWEEFETATKRMNSLLRHVFTYGSPLMSGSLDKNGFDYAPAIDIQETTDSYLVTSDLPGLEKNKINIFVKNNTLTIEGIREVNSEQKNEQAGFYAQERSYGSFARSIPLPGPVDETRINADYKNGVLTITLPKSKTTIPVQKVQIQ